MMVHPQEFDAIVLLVQPTSHNRKPHLHAGLYGTLFVLIQQETRL